MNHTERDPRLITPEEYQKAKDYAEEEDRLRKAEYKAFQEYLEEDDYLPEVDEEDFAPTEEEVKDRFGDDYL